MTAIDQSLLGQVPVRNPKHGIAHDDGHGAAKREKGAKSFDDLMADSEQMVGKSMALDDLLADSADTAPDAVDSSDQPTATTPAAAGRIKIAASFQKLLQTATDGRMGQTTAETPLVDKTAGPADKKADGVNAKAPNAKAQNAEKPADASASEQLGALLGMAPAADAEPDGSVTADAGEAKTSEQTAEQRTDISLAPESSAVSAAIDMLDQAASQLQAAAQSAHPSQHEKAADDMPSQQRSDDSDSSDTVRLVSADGKGRPVDIGLTDEAGTGEPETAPPTNGKTDFVTVLESRRYLAFSSDTNANTLANAIKADPSWSQALTSVTAAQNALEGNTSTTLNTLKLQMNPDNLGSMTASLRLKGDELTVEVKVETIEAYRHLTNDQDQIVKALKDQGFSIDQVSIQLSAPEKSGQSQDNGNQQQNGQDQRDGLGQNARQREENARRAATQGLWQNNDQTSSQSDPVSVTGNADTGDIYL